MLTTDVGNDVDTQGNPAAAERKRRRAAVPENSPSTAEASMDAVCLNPVEILFGRS
jgi:hypothetical protein